MKRLSCYSLLLAAMLLVACGQQAEKELYVSTSFHEPATDGLRML